eukprot:Rhum_TRINITY_DN18542_c0_g1::Rhum_TRINITY_DN18542_c0_g1_i1::g.167569::m.167569
MFARSAATALLSKTAIAAMPVRQSSRSLLLRSQQQQQRRPFTLGPSHKPTQHEMNNLRTHLDEDMQWLPEAMWVDGRRATMGELYDANPNMADLEIDEQLQNRNRKHPLHQGIKAALERRIAVLKQAEEEEGGWEYLDEAPEGLTDMQKHVYLELKKQAAPRGTDTKGAKVLIKKTLVQGTEDKEVLRREQYLVASKKMTTEDIKKFNRAGEELDDNLFETLTAWLRRLAGISFVGLCLYAAVSFLRDEGATLLANGKLF